MSSSKTQVESKAREAGVQSVGKLASEKQHEKGPPVGDSEPQLQQLPKLRYQESKEPAELHSLFTTQAVAAFTKQQQTLNLI
jgi:hypothetical protein